MRRLKRAILYGMFAGTLLTTPVTAAVAKGEADAQMELAGITERTVTATAGCSATQLQELLNENADGAYRLTVVIPAGTYKMDRPLYVYPNTTIVATGATLIKQSNYDAMVEAKLIADDGGYDGNHDITIDGGTWDSSPVQKAAEGTETFRFIHSNNITIKNATLCNVPQGSHLIVFAGVQNGTITNCKFYGYGADWKKATTPKEAVQLDMVHSSKEVPTNQASEIRNWDDLPCDNITIKNCEFYNFSRGIGSHTAVAGRLHSNITIQNNKFHDLSESAIRLYNYKDTVVSGNTINNAVAGVLAYTYIEASDENAYFEPNNKVVGKLPADYNIQITGNTIKNIKADGSAWGDGIRIIGCKERPIKGVEIKGNTITSTKRSGIFASGAPDIQIHGNNQISSASTDGIMISENCTGAAIYSNTIKNPAGNGIFVINSNKTKVYGNRISSPAENGIYLLKSTNCTVGGTEKTSGNAITDAGKSGIWISSKSGQTQITGNQITKYAMKAKGYGIYAYQSGGTVKNNTLIQDNTITGTGKGSGKDGIRLSESDYTTISGNKVIKAMGAGIYVYQSKNCIIGSSRTDYNTIQNPTAQGIYLTKASDNGKVQYNRITGVKKDGIGIFGSANVGIMGNTISAKANGINVTSKSTQAVIQDNIIKKYGSSGSTCGIYINQSGGTSTKKQTRIIGNTITGTNKRTKNPGIKLSNAPYVLIQKNKISSAQGAGIYLLKSKKCTITSNTITAAKERGIYATKGCDSAKITKNTVKNATGVSISIYQAPGSVLSGNKVTAKKTQRGIWVSQSNKSKIQSNTVKGAKPREEILVTGSTGCVSSRNKMK